jgi:DNA recombination protein RmuC
MLDAIAARPDLVLLALAGLAIVALILAANSVIMRRYRAANSMIIAMIREQAEASARMAAIGEMLSGRQADLTRAVNERLDSVGRPSGCTATLSDALIHAAVKLGPRKTPLALTA